MIAIIKNICLIFFIIIGLGKTSFSQTPTKHIIEIKRMKFNPEELHLKKGDTVVWVNKDFFPHDVAKFDNHSWQSSPLNQNQSWSKVVTKSEDYYCTLHVVMKGKLIID